VDIRAHRELRRQIEAYGDGGVGAGEARVATSDLAALVVASVGHLSPVRARGGR